MTEITFIIITLLIVYLFILIWILIKHHTNEALIKLKNNLAAIENRHEHTERFIKDEISRNREETAYQAKLGREELGHSLINSSDALLKRMTENAGMQKDLLDSFSKQLGDMTQVNEKKIEAMRQTVESRLRSLQEDNSKKLEQMRGVVEEKLQDTLEKRLGESFKQVSERLEQVYKGLGEMRSLAW